MKKIEAIGRPFKVSEVEEALGDAIRIRTQEHGQGALSSNNLRLAGCHSPRGLRPSRVENAARF
jgi:hypothetical protein